MSKTILENTSVQIVEKKSKFIANIYYVQSQEEVENILKEIRKKYYDARHNCYAYSILTNNGIVNKMSDDGEPSGTAGAPMLSILANEGLSNVLVIVTRYFGGVLLGTGGLVRAYSEAVKEALKLTEYVQKTKGYLAKLEIEYNDIDKIKYYLKQNNINIVGSQYSENVELTIEVTDVNTEKFTNNVKNRNINIIKYDIIEEKNIEI